MCVAVLRKARGHSVLVLVPNALKVVELYDKEI
jgi:hypothetical protein